MLIFGGCQSTQESSKPRQKPNIIFMLSDDRAYQAISSYSIHFIETPNIDRLASEGTILSLPMQVLQIPFVKLLVQ